MSENGVPEKWSEVAFEDFTTLQRGKDLTRAQFKDGTVPVAGSNGIIGYHDTAIANAPGVTVGRSGSAGKVTVYDEDFWPHNTSLYVRDFHGNDPLFAGYFLEHLDLRRFKTGASVPTLDRNSFKTLPVLVPPLPEQKKIAHILSTVQRAIEAQERIIQTTTELKKALMHKLFTEGLRNEPQKQTEIGPVPESWEVLEIGDLGKCITGSTPKTKVPEFYDPPSEDFVAPADIGARRYVYDSEKKISPAGMATIRPIPKNAVMCVCIGSSIGKVGMSYRSESATNQQINSIVCNDNRDPEFIYFFLSFLSDYWKGFATFGPVPILSKGRFTSIPVATPSSIEEQQGIAKPLVALEAKVEVAEKKVQTLQALFRTLLHELMTANTRVHDVALEM